MPLWTGGCAQKPVPPLSAPEAKISVDHFLGTPLSGPTVQPIPKLDAIAALSLRATYIASDQAPKPVFEPLGARARLVSEADSGRPFMPSMAMLQQVQFFSADSSADCIAKLGATGAGRCVVMGTRETALPVGVTADLTAYEDLNISDPVTGRAQTRHMELQITRSAAPDTLQVCLLLQNPPTAESQGNLQDAWAVAVEQAVFDLPLKEAAGFCITLPIQFDHSQSKGLTILLQASPGSKDDAHVKALAQCEMDLKHSIDVASKRPIAPPGFPEESASLRSAIHSLKNPNSQRTSLVYLADQTQAALCEDAVMVEGQDFLNELSQQLIAALPDDQPLPGNEALGWLLDHQTIVLLHKVLAGSSEEGKPKLSPEEKAILATYTGEVGRSAASLEGVLKGVASHQDLTNRLLAENLIYLEDSSPGSRVRAFDWLKSRGQAPPGYDPLASAKERRVALEQNTEAQSAPAAANPPQQGGAQ